MYTSSFVLAAASLAQLVVGIPQGAPVAETLTSAPAVTQQCGGCYAVADVAALVFGTFTITQTQTAVVSVATKYNGTTTLGSTMLPAVATIVVPETGGGAFSYSPSAIIPGGTQFIFGTSAVVDGQTLTSPTPYAFFTAYSITSTTVGSDGSCTPVRGTAVKLPNAFTVAGVEGVAPEEFLESAENAFITAQGYPTCSGGGVNPTTTTLQPVQQITVTSITLGAITPTPIAISLAIPTATFTGPPVTSTATTTFIEATTTVVVVGTYTFSPSVSTAYTTTNATIIPFVPGSAASKSSNKWQWLTAVGVMLVSLLML